MRTYMEVFRLCFEDQLSCRQNKRVRYYRLGRLLEALKLGHVDGSYLKQLTQLQKLDLLILDDWGLGGFKGKQISDLLDVSEDRYEQRSTIIISQLPVKEWYGLMKNPTVADALLDRLIHNAYRIELSGESQRKKSVAEPVEVSSKVSRYEEKIRWPDALRTAVWTNRNTHHHNLLNILIYRTRHIGLPTFINS